MNIRNIAAVVGSAGLAVLTAVGALHGPRTDPPQVSSSAPTARAERLPNPADRRDLIPADRSVPMLSPAFGQTVVGTDTRVWPATSYGAIRLWDTGTTWRDLEPRRGVFIWSALDARVTGALAHRAKPLMVLGQTPAWASKRPAEVASFGLGTAAEPTRLSDWDTYVRAVASRYKGRIEAYELWNEANLGSMFSGPPAVMAEMTRRAASIIHAVDPQAVVVSPSFGMRYTTSLPYLDTFAKAGGFRGVDVVGVHAYPEHGKGPEDMYTLLRATSARLDQDGVHLPIWQTEITFGLIKASGGHPRIAFLGQTGAGMVARAMLLTFASGTNRIYWYAWNDLAWGGTPMVDAALHPTPAGVAYGQVYAWMVDHRMDGCTVVGPVYSCRLVQGSQTSLAVWTVGPASGLRVPAGYTRLRTLDGSSRAVTPGTTLTLSALPQLLVPAQPMGTHHTQAPGGRQTRPAHASPNVSRAAVVTALGGPTRSTR